jgi:hypothetical protein
LRGARRKERHRVDQKAVSNINILSQVSKYLPQYIYKWHDLLENFTSKAVILDKCLALTGYIENECPFLNLVKAN